MGNHQVERGLGDSAQWDQVLTLRIETYLQPVFLTVCIPMNCDAFDGCVRENEGAQAHVIEDQPMLEIGKLASQDTILKSLMEFSSHRVEANKLGRGLLLLAQLLTYHRTLIAFKIDR